MFRIIYKNKTLEIPRFDINELLKGYNPEEETDLWEGIEDNSWPD